MNCLEAIRVIFTNLKEDDICLFTTGFISRRAFAINDRKANFYMLGSMGLLSSVGLGIALNTDKKVVVFDGDGSALMDLGTMAMISYYKPGNLFHIVLNNKCYESTGGQASVVEKTDFTKVARALGYSKSFNFCDTNSLKQKIASVLNCQGPLLVELVVERGHLGSTSRVTLTPGEITARIIRLSYDT